MDAQLVRGQRSRTRGQPPAGGVGRREKAGSPLMGWSLHVRVLAWQALPTGHRTPVAASAPSHSGGAAPVGSGRVVRHEPPLPRTSVPRLPSEPVGNRPRPCLRWLCPVGSRWLRCHASLTGMRVGLPSVEPGLEHAPARPGSTMNPPGAPDSRETMDAGWPAVRRRVRECRDGR